jgi:hypothetical protein
MSRNTIFVLMYHRHTLLDLVYITNMDLVYILTLEIGPEIGSSPVNWAQLNRFCLRTETESSHRNDAFRKIKRTVFLDKDRTMDNVQKLNICTNICTIVTKVYILFHGVSYFVC